MQAHQTAQRSLFGGWRTALLSLLVLVLSLQPFICLLHCAHLDLLRQSGATHAYHMLCGAADHAGGETVAAAPTPSTATGAAASVPAYWPGMLNTWTLALGTFAYVLRMILPLFFRSAAFAAMPATPPPR